MGLLFVALTRVRRILSIAFDPVPSLERVTTNIARKKSLHDRKQHEKVLRALSATTAEKYAHLNPPTVLGAPPVPPPAGHISPPASNTRHARKRSADSETRWDEAQKAARRAEEARQQQARYARALTRNEEALAKLELPPFNATPTGAPPSWLRRLVVRTRVIDYLGNHGSDVARSVHGYLLHLGATSVFTNANGNLRLHQIGVSCGIVAPRAAVDMRSANERWQTVDTSRAVEQQWITLANSVIANEGQGSHGTRFVSETEVMFLANQFWASAQGDQPEDPGPPCARCGEDHATADCEAFVGRVTHSASTWLKDVTSYDYGMRQIAEDLRRVVSTGMPTWSVRVLNTEDSTQRGMHWFTVAYSAELRPGEQPDGVLAVDEDMDGDADGAAAAADMELGGDAGEDEEDEAEFGEEVREQLAFVDEG